MRLDINALHITIGPTEYIILLVCTYIILRQKYSIVSSIIFLLQYYNEAKGVCIHFMCVYCGSNILTIEKIMLHIMI